MHILDNVAVKMKPAKVPPHTHSFCLHEELDGPERNYEINNCLTFVIFSLTFLSHRPHGCDSIGQGDQKENNCFLANCVLHEATGKHSEHSQFLLDAFAAQRNKVKIKIRTTKMSKLNMLQKIML